MAVAFRISLIVAVCFALVASTLARVKDYQKRNLDTVSKIYNLTVYPNNLAFIANGSASVPKGLFAENATGRITPVGNFSGFDDSTEYFFALAPIPLPPAYGAFTKAQVVEFTSGCPNIAASTVHFTTSVVKPNSTDNGKYLTSLKQVAFWEFDSTGAVTKYEAWIPNIRLYTTGSQGGPSTVAPAPPAQQKATIASLCGTIQQLCTGPNTQYNSTATCESTLGSKTFGDYDNIWADSVTCREIHILLARIRPEVHCPHVGPTGGMKCVDVPYNYGYFDDQELFGAPLGGTFMCPETMEKEL